VKLALVTDAWLPQVNGVVTTLLELQEGLWARGHEVVVIEPSSFRRFRCPGYREIELAWGAGRQVEQMLDGADADAIHIATEGPLGTAARRYCLRRGLAFTTAFHTRFPDILARALHVPERWGYAWFKRFHAPSAGVMVPTEGMLGILRGHGFANLRQWSHGVDLRLFEPLSGVDLGLPRPIFLYVGRVSYEKNLEAFLELDLPGSKLVYGVGPLLERLRREHPQVQRRRRVRLPEPQRDLRAGHAGGDGLRHAGGGLPGAGTAGRGRRLRRGRAPRGPAACGAARAGTAARARPRPRARVRLAAGVRAVHRPPGTCKKCTVRRCHESVAESS
jgi:glycosyltransferase involved in cell wall biosynthesis